MIKTSNNKTRNPFILPAIGALVFIALLIMISYMFYRLDTIQETLESRVAYQPPVTAPASGKDEQALFTTRHDHIVYVPVYSHIYSMGGEPVLLETTLSIRNTDPEKPIVITSIDYYDTKGNIIEKYIDGQLHLEPLESTEVLVQKNDLRGGSGANFLVVWKAADPVHPPLVQAIMAGSRSGHDISFLTKGQSLSSRIQPE